MTSVTFQLNGVERTFSTEPGERLRDLLHRNGFRTVRNGCDGEGSCGACAVVLDGRVVNSCLLLSGQAEGREVLTLDHYNRLRSLDAVQSALVDAGGVQCGYCTPALVLAIHALLARSLDPSDDEIRDALSGVFCRCTGYQQFFTAVRLAAARLGDRSFEGTIAPEFREDLRHVGKLRPKVDGADLVRGAPCFVEDRVAPDACHLKMLRSPHPHAYIRRIHTDRAEAMPGVVAVLTCDNTPEVYYGSAGQGYPEPSPYDRRMFGRKVRHIGDRVAAVVAETEEQALQALEAIEVEYEVLDPVFHVEDALREGAPRVHAGVVEYMEGTPADLDNSEADPRDGRIIYPFPIHGDPRRNIAAGVEGGIGDVEAGLAEADVVVERTYESRQQIQCTPLEPHIVYTRMDGDRLVVHASTQVPWHLRRIISRILGVRENQVRIIKERTGGAFGSKQDMVLEEVAAYATWITGRPVLFRFTREEEFLASRTRHPMKFRVRMGARRDGTLTALDLELRANTGPYGSHCLTVPMNACSKSLPLLLCDNVHFRVTTCYSNIQPTGAYQGYGAPKGSYAVQLAAAEMADALGMDHLAFLEKNRVREGSVLEILKCLGEGREGTPQEVFSCGLGPALERGARLIEWGEPVAHGDPDWRTGKGLAIIQQGSGLPELDSANATVTMFGDGTFMLLSGGTDLGTGLDTVTVKMVAEELCVPMEHVSLIAADTDVTPFDVGAYASSGTFFSGGAALEAARGMHEMLLREASEMLSEPTVHLALEYPGQVRGRTGVITYRDIALRTQSGTGRGQLTATRNFITDKASFPYGAHFCQVAVNVRTGQVRVQRYYALQDAGTPINPELTLGQIYGGALKTIGHTLYEGLITDVDGRPLNPHLLDYKVPMIGDLPDDFRAELVETDDPFGPYGAKSVSEIACNGAAPAIASAIHDAVGVWMREWPFTPERVIEALQGRDRAP